VEIKTNGNDLVNVDEALLIQQIEALQPSKQLQKIRLFEKLYPVIQDALAREVPQKAIVAELAKAGLHLSMGGFRSLLAVMREQQPERAGEQTSASRKVGEAA
jgi:hypothetical protein